MAYDSMYVNLVFRDSKGRDKRKKVELSTTDAALGETAGAAAAALFQAVTQCAIVRYDVYGRNEVSASPDAGSNIDAGMTVTVQLAGRDKKATLKWPAPTEAIQQSDGTLILTDTDVAALEDFFQSGGTGLLSDGELIDSFLTGKLDK